MDSPGDSIVSQGLFVGLLEMLFPGLTYLPYVAALTLIARYILDSWSNSITARFTSTVEINSHDASYNYVMDWVSRNRLSRENYRLLASTSISNNAFTWSDENASRDRRGMEDSIEETRIMGNGVTDLRSKIALYNARPLHWTPAMGTHFFRYEGRFLSFKRSIENQNSMGPRQPEKLVISCLGRDATVLKKLIYSARLDYLEKERGRTSIYRATRVYHDEDLSWTKCMSKATRPMSTIALDESVKQRLIKDLQRYLDPKTERWYETRGIPHRRGYLFSGPPGTGKTSLTLAAAGLMGLDIYMINLDSPRLNEDNLASLFQDLPHTCVVLLEDIDATGLTQKRKRQVAGKGLKQRKKRSQDGVSLSGLLNIIDGVAAQEGRVLVMTSNHTENIDPALLRPGRIDFSIKFGLATKGTAVKIFTQMYDIPEEDQGEKEADKEGASLRVLAAEFGKRIPELVLSPAAIQGFLLTHQDDPEGAVGAVDGWVEEAMRDKAVAVPEKEEPREEESKESEGSESGDDGSEDGDEGED
ncbi:hypothetical protein ACJ41O_007135 [Fusarium nematophilum]